MNNHIAETQKALMILAQCVADIAPRGIDGKPLPAYQKQLSKVRAIIRKSVAAQIKEMNAKQTENAAFLQAVQAALSARKANG